MLLTTFVRGQQVGTRKDKLDISVKILEKYFTNRKHQVTLTYRIYRPTVKLNDWKGAFYQPVLRINYKLDSLKDKKGFI